MSSDDVMFMKRLAIRKMAVDMAIPEKTVELVIAYTFKKAREAFHQHGSIEISGFGRFVLNKYHVKHRIMKIVTEIERWEEQLADPGIDERMKKNRLLWLEKVRRDLELIRTLTHED